MFCELTPNEGTFWFFLVLLGYGFIRFLLVVKTGKWPGVGEDHPTSPKVFKICALIALLVFGFVIIMLITQKVLGTCGY